MDGVGLVGVVNTGRGGRLLSFIVEFLLCLPFVPLALGPGMHDGLRLVRSYSGCVPFGGFGWGAGVLQVRVKIFSLQVSFYGTGILTSSIDSVLLWGASRIAEIGKRYS